MKIGGEPLREIGGLLGDEVRVWRWKRALAIAERAHGSSTKAHQPARGAEMMRQSEEVGQMETFKPMAGTLVRLGLCDAKASGSTFKASNLNTNRE